MIRSYITTAGRSFKRNKFHTLINIVGLSLGIMTSVLAMMFIVDETSYDKFHSKLDRIVRLNKINTEENGSKTLTAETSGMMGPTMVEEFPEVETAVRFKPWFDGIMLTNKDRNVLTKETELIFVDSTFFKVFDFKLLRGNASTVLTRPQTMVITGKIAQGLFGNEDPIGKTVIGMNSIEFEITGIIEEAPRTSSIQYAGLMSWTSTVPNLGKVDMEWMNNWIAQGINTFLLLKPGADQQALQTKFGKFMQDHMPTRVDKYALYLQPFNEIYLHSQDLMAARMAKMGNIEYVNLFLVISAFVLIIACVNYINIATSKATRRSREVGMRKVMGAAKRQLIYQFIGESFLLTLFASIFAIGLLYFAVPYFNDLAGKTIVMSLLLDPGILMAFAGLIAFVGIVSGLYPSLVISSFSPALVLRADSKSKLTGNWARYALITFQFGISIVMIAGTLVVYQQIKFILAKDLGFDKEHVLVLTVTDEIFPKREVFKNEIDQIPGIVTTSLSRSALGQGRPSTYVIPEGFKPDEVAIRMFPVDHNFAKTYGLEMAKGRFFDPKMSTDSAALIINEALARRLNWTDPIQKTIRFNEGQPAYPVIGLLKDFYYKSLYEEVEPLVMWISPENTRNLSIRFSGNPSSLIASLESIWKRYETRYPFEFYFVDEQFAKSYASEQKLFQTVVTFAGMSILVACLGLYGLVSYTIEQRRREFGIRKVLGASVASLNVLVNQKFVLMVLIAAVIAIPNVLPFVNDWLQKFAFKADLGPWPFIEAVGITLAVTLAAVCSHAIKVATANPVDSLRHE